MLGVSPTKDCFLGVNMMLRCGTKEAESSPYWLVFRKTIEVSQHVLLIILTLSFCYNVAGTLKIKLSQCASLFINRH